MEEQEEEILLKDSFEKDFFSKLRDYMFKHSLDEYLKNEFKYNIQDFMYIYNDPNRKNKRPNYEKIDIKTFKDFLYYKDNDEDFGFVITLRMIRLLYCIKHLKNIEIKNEDFELRIFYESIIKKFYNSEIIDKLSNTKLDNIKSSTIAKNKFIAFAETKQLNVLKTNILFFIFDYISVYIEKILNEIVSDIDLLLEVYKYEAKYKLNSNNFLSRDILKTIKKMRTNKYKQKQGRKNRIIPQIDIDEYNQTCEIVKDTLDENKKIVEKIIKNSKNNKQKAIQEFNKTFEDSSFPEYTVLNMYFNEKLNNPEFASNDLIKMMFLDEIFNLHFFNKDIDKLSSYDNMKKYFKRHSQIFDY